MSGKLPGKVALVTGAGKRLGRAVALRLAEEGADVAVHYHDSAKDAAEVVGKIEEMGQRAVAIRADLRSVDEIRKLFLDTGNELGRRSKGSIVNFADTGGLLGWPGYISHSVSKAGVVMLTKCLAKALAPDVRVNAIAPGTITMPGDPPEWEQEFVKLAPLRRTGRPSDIADAVIYLATAEFLTGHTLVVDGGRVA